jgi:hypothetical protein
MKTKTVLFCLIIIFVFGILIIKTSAQIRIGAYDMQFSGNSNLYNDYQSLKFNLFHKYLGRVYENNHGVPIGWDYDLDKLNSPIGDYQSLVQNKLDYNFSYGLKTWMDRPKTLWLCFGQRSDYQCEDSCFLDSELQDYWFYTYKNVGTVGINYIDNSVYGNGERVKYCKANGSLMDPCNNEVMNMSPGYVVKGLKANNEQVNIQEECRWEHDNDYMWYIRPRIRIDKDFANNPANRDKEICRIERYNFDGELLADPYILRVRNFNDYGDIQYNGSYFLDNYYIRESWNDKKLEFNGMTCDMNPNKISWAYTSSYTCHADYAVKWSGECDMWIDYVRLENQTAKILNDLNDPSHQTYLDWISWEASLANHNGT